MNYKIIDVEGIGDVYAKKLIDADINTIEELLKKCAKHFLTSSPFPHSPHRLFPQAFPAN